MRLQGYAQIYYGQGTNTQALAGLSIIDFTFLIHADLNPVRANNRRLVYIEEATNAGNYDALMLGPLGLNTSSTGEARSITSATMTYDQQSVGWSQTYTYQRIYVNGLEKTNATQSTINQYTAVNLVINGIGKSFYEVLFYNYDMMDVDFERAAQDQLATFRYRKGGIPCTGGQWDYTNID